MKQDFATNRTIEFERLCSGSEVVGAVEKKLPHGKVEVGRDSIICLESSKEHNTIVSADT